MELRQLLGRSGDDVDLDAYRRFHWDRNSGLLLAAQHGHVTIAEMLLDAGADFDKCNQSWGCSPLLLASQGGHRNLVTLLLNRGADLELSDRGGKTPLMAAAENGHVAVVKSLLSLGARVDAVSGFEKVPQEIRALMNSSHISATEMEELKDPYKKSTALLKACWGGHLDIVELLVQNGCNTEVQTYFGNTPLHICSLRGYDYLLHYLVQRKFPLDVQNRLGETPLHTVCRELFLVGHHHQAAPCRMDRKSTQIGAFEKFVWMFEVLIRSGSDVKQKDSKGRALLYKLLTGRFQCAENSSCHLNNSSSENSILYLNNRRLYLVRLVLSATDRISFTDLPTPDEVSPELNELHSDLLPWLMTFSRSPRSLQHIARCVVRSLSRSGDTQLPVTSVMNDYVLLNGV